MERPYSTSPTSDTWMVRSCIPAAAGWFRKMSSVGTRSTFIGKLMREFSGRFRNSAFEKQQQARFKPPERIRVAHQMRAKFGDRFAITVEGLHRRQASSQRENAERTARLPRRLIPALAVE